MTYRYFSFLTFIIVFVIVNFTSLSVPHPFCCRLLILLLSAYFTHIEWIFIGAVFIAIDFGCCLFWRMSCCCCLSSTHLCFSGSRIIVLPDSVPCFPTSLPTSIYEFTTTICGSLSSMPTRHLVDRPMSGRGLGTSLCRVFIHPWGYIPTTTLSIILCTVYTQPWSFSTIVSLSSWH